MSFGHRRLSIIDLDPRSDQPLHSHDGRYSIVFNGEIYNYKELRDSLKSGGSVFRTRSDTEVLIELFRVRGKSMLPELRGMFAFAIWDNLEKRLVLARDPYGIKPLYYAKSNLEFRFASQVKTLLEGGVTGSPDPAAVVGFHLFGSVPEPFTSVDTIRALPAGHYIELSGDGMESEGAFSSIGDLIRPLASPKMTSAERGAEIRRALLDSVKAHLVSDVPVGLFLSAGIDSGALLGLMRDANSAEISTLTLAFDEFSSSSTDESVVAAQVARHYGANHYTHRIGLSDCLAALPAFFEAMDQPTIDGLNTYFISKAAAECGLKIAISGIGGDELFAGYPSFRNIPRDVSRIRSVGLGKGTTDIAGSSLPSNGRSGRIDPKIETLLRYGSTYQGAYLARRCVFTPQELLGVMDRDLASAGLARLQPLVHLANQAGSAPRNSFETVAILESTMYLRNQILRDTDWASMAHSLEVRTPLVDSFFLRELAPFMGPDVVGRGKRDLALAPGTALPDSVTMRPKTGFSTPISQWLQETELLGDWRNCPMLRHKNTKWAKRWAYLISRHFFGDI